MGLVAPCLCVPGWCLLVQSWWTIAYVAWCLGWIGTLLYISQMSVASKLPQHPNTNSALHLFSETGRWHVYLEVWFAESLFNNVTCESHLCKKFISDIRLNSFWRGLLKIYILLGVQAQIEILLPSHPHLGAGFIRSIHIYASSSQTLQHPATSCLAGRI